MDLLSSRSSTRLLHLWSSRQKPSFDNVGSSNVSISFSLLNHRLAVYYHNASTRDPTTHLLSRSRGDQCIDRLFTPQRIVYIVESFRTPKLPFLAPLSQPSPPSAHQTQRHRLKPVYVLVANHSNIIVFICISQARPKGPLHDSTCRLSCPPSGREPIRCSTTSPVPSPIHLPAALPRTAPSLADDAVIASVIDSR